MKRLFTESHEWVEIDGDIATVGITDYAQEQMGDVVFVELQAPGTEIERSGEAAVVESVKAASEVYSPLSGTVTEANSTIEDDPSLVNSKAETVGWFIRLKVADLGELEGLMDEAAYADYLAGLN